MKNYWTKSVLFMTSLFILVCGSGRKLAENPQPLGFVPFSAADMAGPATKLNQQLETELRNSGSFLLHVMDSIPSLWNLNEMESAANTPVKWIVTGKFYQENVKPEKGTKIPYILNTPKSSFAVQIEYRLYSLEKKGWQEIEIITAKNSHSGNLQIGGYDDSDPSLIMDAKERQLLRRTVYKEACQKLIKKIEKGILKKQ